MIKRLLLAGAVALGLTTPAFADQTCSGGALLGMVIGGTSPNCYYATVNADGSIPITGTISASLSGFTPNGNVANLSVTNSSGNVALPAGTVVAVANTGANTAHIKLSVGAGSAATTDYSLQAGAAIGVTVGSNTFINAITDSSTTTLSLAGGSGLLTGYGAVTVSGTNAAAGATGAAVPASASYSGGNLAGNLVGQTIVNPTGSVEAAQTDLASIKGVSVATGTGAQSTGTPRVTVATDSATVAGSASLPAGTNLVGKVGIDQTTPGTTNAVSDTNFPATVDTNSGNKSASTPRFVLATDQPALTNALKVDGSAVTQPVSGTVTANAGTNLNTSALATSANQPSNLAQEATTAGATANEQFGCVTTSAPTYVTAKSDCLSLTTAGALRTDASASTQPVSGTVTANAGTNLNTSALALETGGNLATLAGAVTSNVVQSNTKQVNGVATSTGTGAVGTGSQRVAVGTDTATIAGSAPGTAGSASAQVVTVQGVASMTKLLVTPDSVALPANQSVNVAQVNGVTTLTGTGAQGTGAQRVTVATDSATVAGSASLPTGTNTIGAAQPIGVSTGGISVFTKQVANNTTSFAVDASAGTLYGINVYNNSGTIAYLKLYNTAQGSVTCGTPTPVDRHMIPANTNGAGAVIPFPLGIAYGTAITACVTTGFADNDTTAPAASTYIVDFYYK